MTMSDIAMCKGTGCPIKEQCRRHTAKANPYRQSYFSTPPIVGDRCDYFWSNTKPNNQIINPKSNGNQNH